jgi:Carboxypeptidase regulatory-like domain
MRTLLVRLALLLGLAAPVLARAQVGATTDIILGKVVNAQGAAMPGVDVRVVSTETQIGRNATTNASGRFTVVFPDGGGNYRVTAKFVGFQPVTISVNRAADEDRLMANITLGGSIPQLSTVRTTARRTPRGDAGGTGRNLSPQQVERLPIDGSDPNALAAITPGVVGISSTDTSGSAFSVAGQRPTLNSVTVDGTTFNGSTVPQEALRSTRVITSTYDVSRGQFTGGQVASTTRGGTNTVQGSFAYYFRNPALSFGNQGPTAFSQLRNQNQLSGGFGGPIVKDRLFSFSAFQLTRRSDDLVDLLNATPSDLTALGLNVDSVAKFIQALRAKGVPLTAPGVPAERLYENLTAFQRFDLIIDDNNSLLVRGDFRGRLQDGARVNPNTLPTVGSHVDAAGGGLLLALTSHFSGSMVNELRTYAQRDYTTNSPYLNGVSGRILPLPDVDTVTTGISSLQFGGNPGLPSTTSNDLWESADEISWISPQGGHRVRLGTLFDYSEFSQLQNSGVNGIYSFNSITAFETDSPASFTRTFNAIAGHGGVTSGAVYIGDTWIPTSPLQLTYGVRVEGTEFRGAPAENPEVEQDFHLNTHNWPSEIHASPRVGFQYIFRQPGGGPPSAVIRGGFGEFRANAPTSLFSSAQSQTGFPGAESETICTAPNIPFNGNDWPGYFNGSVPVPSNCPAAPQFDSLRTVSAFQRDFESPRAWRGSLGVSKRLWGNVNGSVDLTYARGTHLFGVQDANLNTSPKFYLPNENNRPVYTTIIDSTTGTSNVQGSRLYPTFGNVYAINSNLQSDTRQATVALNGFSFGGLTYQLSYTYSHIRDQSSFAGGAAGQGYGSPTTGGDPNVVGWGTSDLQRTHQFIGTVSWPIVPSLEITSIIKVTSGQPFSPLVSQDINGDGSRNDRAMVFNPASLAGTDDSALIGPMKQLLANAPGRIKDCLNSQLGQIAARNSCAGPWVPGIDLQINYRPAYWGLQHKLTLSLLLLNTLTGLDDLVHGPNHLAGWGQSFPPDPILLYVQGFNASQQRYIYTVNQHFGQPYTTLGAYSAPFQLALEVRYAFGEITPDQLRSIFGGGGGRGGGGGGGGGGGREPGGGGGPGGAGGAGGAPQSLSDLIAQRFSERFPNPFAAILMLQDSLQLTTTEITALQADSESLATQADSLKGALQAQLNKLGKSPDPGTMIAMVRPQLQRARALQRDAIDKAQKILTPEQWKRVPASIKTPSGGPR